MVAEERREGGRRCGGLVTCSHMKQQRRGGGGGGGGGGGSTSAPFSLQFENTSNGGNHKPTGLQIGGIRRFIKAIKLLMCRFDILISAPTGENFP